MARFGSLGSCGACWLLVVWWFSTLSFFLFVVWDGSSLEFSVWVWAWAAMIPLFRQRDMGWSLTFDTLAQGVFLRVFVLFFCF
jgi:hypothetical protein